ncbi:MAG TPA: acetyl-coenzyme A synthetase N-terminal domain-containing protein, partial [Pontiella sp.]|nr:acetyl-coenzyme A synthetase N-terminal domain-containing protein [Pontiella sp.]
MAQQAGPQEVFAPPSRVSEGAYVPDVDSYRKMYARSISDPEGFWGAQAEEHIEWFHRFSQVSDCDFTQAMNAWFL